MSGSQYTTTPNLGLIMPNYDMDDGMWGYHLNTNTSVLDSAIGALSGGAVGGPWLPLSGGSISGPLNLSGLPYSQADGSPPTGARTGDVYINGVVGKGGFLCTAP